MVSKKKATIILPAYNEAKAIGVTLQALMACPGIEAYEVLVVDDGSTDETGKIVETFPVRLLKHPANTGYGSALKTGIRNAQTEKILMMDSDGQHSPAAIDAIYNKLDFFSLVIGQRGTGSNQEMNRLVGKKIVRIIAEYLMGQKLPDFNSGLRGFQRSKIIGMLHIMPNGFSFSTTSTLAFIKQGYPIDIVPIQIERRVGRRSTVKFFRDGLKTILLILRICMLFQPLKIFVPSSLLMGIWGLGRGFYQLAVHHRIFNSTVIILLLSIFLFFIGLLADQISMLNLREIPIGSDVQSNQERSSKLPDAFP